MLQHAIVFSIVAAAALYAAWRWLPVSARAALVSRIVLLGGRAGLSTEQAERLQRRASSQAGCGECGPCKACKTEESR